MEGKFQQRGIVILCRPYLHWSMRCFSCSRVSIENLYMQDSVSRRRLLELEFVSKRFFPCLMSESWAWCFNRDMTFMQPESGQNQIRSWKPGMVEDTVMLDIFHERNWNDKSLSLA